MKYLAFLIALFAVPAFAEIKLNAPTDAVVGQLIRIDCTESDCEDLIFEVIPETEDFEAIGKKAFLSSRTGGEYLVIVAGSEENKPVLKTHRIYVEPLVPPDPDDKTVNIDSEIRRWLTQVRSDGGKEEARKLAQSFRFVAGSPHTKLNDFLAAAASSNRMVLGDSLEAWKPFLDGLGRYLDQNQPRSLDQYKEVWIAIAAAIERHVQ
jgi:hypothetical protein